MPNKKLEYTLPSGLASVNGTTASNGEIDAKFDLPIDILNRGIALREALIQLAASRQLIKDLRKSNNALCEHIRTIDPDEQ